AWSVSVDACARPRVLVSFPTRRSSDLPVQQLRPVSVRSPAGMAVWSNRLFIFVPVLRLCWKPDDLLVYDLGRSNRSARRRVGIRSEEHTSELQSREDLVCRLLPETKRQ